MNDIVTDLAEPTLVTAIKANLYAFFRSFRRSPQAEFYESSKLMRWQTPVPHPWFNGVLSTQPAADNEEQTIQDTVAYFKARNVTSFTWWLEPSLQPAAWASQLLPHGFRYDDNTPGMAVDLAALPQSVQHPATLVIRQVEDRETLSAWAHTLIRGFQLPEVFTTPFFEFMASLGLKLPIQHYLGYLNDEPVAASTLFLGAGVAGIYNVATVSEARGRGIGASLTLLPLQQARAMGYRAGVLQSSVMGFSVYRRLGFQSLCAMDHFYWRLARVERAANHRM